MQLRKHQREFKEVIDGIIAGSSIRKIVVSATPGSGKSLLPLLAGRLIAAGKADKIAWICPRSSLQDQGERNFMNRQQREITETNLTIRSSTNDVDPCRNTDGWISTFQALGVDYDRTVLMEFNQRRYILVVDENHHAEAEDGAWMKAIAPLCHRAAYVVFMSGTMSRGDKKKVAFIPYSEIEEGIFAPCFEDSEDTAFIEYSRTDAISDKSIIPLSFVLSDGHAEWEKHSKKKESKISTTTPMARDALFTALRTGFAEELLEAAVAHWKGYKNEHPSSRLLVVAANIKVTKDYTKFLQAKGISAVIATSDDDKAALKAIRAFKSGEIDVLTTCQVCYEGLDCPSISHIACLTNIRSEEWIIQMCGRAVRIDPLAGPYETQRGFVFAPADRMFCELAAKIEADQCAAYAVKNPANGNGRPTGENGSLFGDQSATRITPLSSRMIAEQQKLLQAALFAEQTVSEQEGDVLGQIESHIRRYAFNNRFNPKRLNSEVYQFFMKARRDKTLKELKGCLDHVKRVYPISYIRGTGRARVPTKAEPFPCDWL